MLVEAGKEAFLCRLVFLKFTYVLEWADFEMMVAGKERFIQIKYPTEGVHFIAEFRSVRKLKKGFYF